MKSLWDVSPGRILLYYIIVGCFLVYSIYKYRKNNFFILIVFTFFIGLFVFLGKNVLNVYRILLVLYALILAKKFISLKTLSGDLFIVISFILFSVAFLLSSFLNQDNLTLLLSQYSRYLLLFLIFFILQRIMPYPALREKMNQLVYFLILLQIILSVIKFIVTGQMESIVGSLSFSGGAMATTFPILGFVFLWMYRKGNFSRKDWLFIIGLMFVGFVNYKRAIWFMLPFFMGLFMIFVQKRKIKRSFLMVIALIPFLFYLGIRLNPTLNREQKVWGSFDLNYAFDYAYEYSYGAPETAAEQKVAVGRGGATNYLLNRMIGGNLTKEDLFGKGLTLMYVEGAKDDKYFKEKYNINSIGSANGFFQSYVVFGFIGTFITLLFVFSLLRKVNNKRIQFALICIYFWEFFFYTGTILREPALSFLFVYLITFSNYLSLNIVQARKAEGFLYPQRQNF